MNYSIYSIRKFLSRVLIISALAILPLTQAADFGVADWGMSIDEVKNLETRSNLTPFGETRYLVNRVELGGIQKTRIIYQFNNGYLSEGRFLFSANNPLDTGLFVQQYQQIKAMMTDQYGPPNSDDVLVAQTDAMMALAPENYANELASDRLILKSSWRSSSATILHQLAWNQTKPHHQLVYTPVDPVPMGGSSDTF